MKFELVDFYPITDKNRGNSKKNMLGTVHIYNIDYQFDIRGIRVSSKGKRFYFQIPYVLTLDHETGEEIKYPVFHFTRQEDHDNMMDFLHQQAIPIIIEKIKSQT